MGPAEIGLKPETTLRTEFRKAIGYRFYRMQNISPFDDNEFLYGGTASRIVQRVQTIVLSLEKFDGSKPITMLTFLGLIRLTFNKLK